jgi:hypothetical protein
MAKFPTDVLHKDALSCIIHPDSKRGVVVFTQYVDPSNAPSIRDVGLKTGQQLQKEGISFDRITAHPYVFFSAPYNNPVNIDYSTVESELLGLYNDMVVNAKNMAFIRVDPDQTYVFSSEIRAEYIPPHHIASPEYANAMSVQVDMSKKSLTEYLTIIDNNSKLRPPANYMPDVYNLYSSRKYYTHNTQYPNNTSPIHYNSEILVALPHIPPEYFVRCV